MRRRKHVDRLTELPFEAIRWGVGLGKELGRLAVERMLSKTPFMHRPRKQGALRLATQLPLSDVGVANRVLKRSRARHREMLDKVNPQPATIINFPH